MEDLPKAPPPKGQMDLISADGNQMNQSQSPDGNTVRQEVKQSTLQLTTDEQAWLDSYRAALDKRHPGAVQEMLIYGSKARGHAHAENALDLPLIDKNGCGKLKRGLRWIGYRLAATTDVLLSILAYTQEEWESRRRSGSSSRKAVERDAVRVV